MSVFLFFFFFKQKTAYEMRISDWSSDVCSSDLDIVGKLDVNLLVLPVDSEGVGVEGQPLTQPLRAQRQLVIPYIFGVIDMRRRAAGIHPAAARTIAALDDSRQRSEEHTSELQSLMRISYAVFCLKKNTV